jgi:hypothetical protein
MIKPSPGYNFFDIICFGLHKQIFCG